MPSIEEEVAVVRSTINLHTTCCFKAGRGKKEESRQECVQDTMTAVLNLCLEVLEGSRLASCEICQQLVALKDDYPYCGRHAGILARLTAALGPQGGKEEPMDRLSKAGNR